MAGLSAVSQAQQNEAARKADKLAEQKAQTEYKQQLAKYQLEGMQQTTQFLWDQARVAQLRSVEQQNALDQAQYGQRLIQAAADNYRIQSEGLYDQFVTSEALRATQVGMDYSYTSNKLAAEALNQTADYLSQVNQTALQSDAALIERNRNSQQIMASLAADHQRDMVEYQMMQLAAMAKGADTANSAITRQGGGVTAQRLAITALQSLGQSYGKYLVQQQQRDNQLVMLNGMNDETANRMGQAALQMRELSRRTQYTLERYGADATLAGQQLDQLQIPTFGLSSRQYGRELEALQVKTRGETANALQPYRQQQFFDPLAPMVGMAPTYNAPTKTPTTSGAMILGQAALSIGSSFLKTAYDKEGNFTMVKDGKVNWFGG